MKFLNIPFLSSIFLTFLVGSLAKSARNHEIVKMLQGHFVASYARSSHLKPDASFVLHIHVHKFVTIARVTLTLIKNDK